MLSGSPKKVNSIKIKNKLNKRGSNKDDGSSSSDETDEVIEQNNRKN